MVDDEDYGDKDEDGNPAGGVGAEVLASYLAFAKRAIATRRLLAATVAIAVSSMVIGGLALWPKTYHCEMRLMQQRNDILALRGDMWNDALSGAADLVLRRENLEAIVKSTNLVQVTEERRPLGVRLRDTVMRKVRPPPSAKDREKALIWTLGTKLNVIVDGNALTIAADWTDGQTAALIVEAAEDTFLETRHVAEISTIAEYISILEGHATKIREEVEEDAKQIKDLRAHNRELAHQTLKAGEHAAETDVLPRRTVVPRSRPVQDEESARLKVMLEAKQRAISELETFRNNRLVEMQGKLGELQQKFTSAHPAVLDAQQQILSLQKESPQVSALKSEVADLEGEIKRRASAPGASFFASGGTADAAAPMPNTAAPLPAEIMALLQESNDDLDPAVSAEFRNTVDKYASLRGQISSARIDLDTAQAAFKYRYKVVIPPEAPQKPVKPKVPLVIAGGIIGGILIGLLTAIGMELRSGRIVEQWQVQQVALPILADLRFPPKSSE